MKLSPPLFAVCFLSLALVLSAGSPAYAQDDEEPEMTFEEDDTSEQPKEPEPEPDMDDDGPEPDLGEDGPEPDLDEDIGEIKPLKADGGGDEKSSWQDIVVVVRKPFLKTGRLELLPMWGVTMNDNIIQHVQFTGALNYFLTDVLAVGIEGNYYVKNLREPFDLVARQARRLPTVNKYNWGGAFNFHYVPIYGKFAVLDKHIVHWESFFTIGVGVTQSEVIPRDPAFQEFTNILVTPNIGASMRFFITRFLTINVGVRDYVFIDQYEPTNRGIGMNESPDDAKDNADSSLVNNIVFQAGLSFWFPTSFEYTTFR